jgi:hypothetical protein
MLHQEGLPGYGNANVKMNKSCNISMVMLAYCQDMGMQM